MLSGNKEKINSESASFRLFCLGTTGDKLTGRAGLSFFLHYLDNIGLNLLKEDEGYVIRYLFII